jgi:protein-tyrosine phosphatase
LLDLHCHILPGVDDGAVDLEDAFDMARQALRQECTAVCATSHLWEGLFGTSPETNAREYAALVAAFRLDGMELQVFPGAENFLDHVDPDEFAERAVPLGEAGRYVLLDFAMQAPPPNVPGVIDALKRRGRIAVIAHPERNEDLQADPSPVAEWIERGALIQVNAPSLLGRLGREPREAGEALLAAGAVHVLASDAHSRRRPFCLGEAREYVAGRVGRVIADKLCRENPWKILRGEAVATGPVALEPRSRAVRFLRRLRGWDERIARKERQ